MGARLIVHLLGNFSITWNDRPVDSFHLPRLQSLLGYLVLHHDNPQPRRSLADLLWPESSESGARNNLRQLIYQLRQALPDADRCLASDAASLCWKLDDDQAIDLIAFEQAFREAQAAETQQNLDLQRYQLERAAQAFHGELLPGCYDEWVAPERERVHAIAVAVFHKLITLQDQQRDTTDAILTGQRLILLDPLDENSYLHLMQLQLQNQDRAGALRTYQRAAEVLERELGVGPGEMLQDAYRRATRTGVSRVTREKAADQAPLQALIGRRAEWRQLLEAWRRAESGSAGMVVLSGEAGIGKSRLAEELVSWADRQGIFTACAHAYDVEGRLSLAPVAEWLHDPQIQTTLETLDPVWLMEVARLVPEIRIQHPELPRPEPITEYGQRQRFFDALVRAIRLPDRPTLLLIDDLQWCDQETLEWLHFLLRSSPQRPLLILATLRNDEPPQAINRLFQQLRASRELTAIDLQPLDASETARLASQISGKELELAVAMRLYQETEGNPLFIVEMVQADLQERSAEDGTRSPEDNLAASLPPRMHAVILQRLSQLTEAARRVAEIGAVYGRPFSIDLLLHAGQGREDDAVNALDELWQRHVIREQGANRYDFTHEKLREVAYSEVSSPQRRLLHRRVAQALERLYADQLEPVSDQIAAHYDQAGAPEQAAEYYRMAGMIATGVYDNENAIALFKHGLAALQGLPASAKRDAQELSLLLAIAPPYRFVLGWTAPELGEVLNRGLILCDKVGTPAQRAQVLYGLQSQYVVEARLEKVQLTYAEMRQLFLQTQGRVPRFAGLMYTGARLHMGQLAEARAGFEEIITSHNPEQIRDLQASQGVNYLAHGNAWYAHGLWLLGLPDSALAHGLEGARIAAEVAQPFNQALTVTYLALLQELRADQEAFSAQAEEALVLSEESRATYYRQWAQIQVEFAHAWNRPSVDHLAHLEGAIQAFMETGARLRLPYFLSLLARASQQMGRMEKALETIELAMRHALTNNERCWDADLHRIRGEVLLSEGADPADAEAAFRRSLEIARDQGALAYRLRSSASLARLWISQGRGSEARELLDPLLDQFAEGQMEPDYRTAQILLS